MADEFVKREPFGYWKRLFSLCILRHASGLLHRGTCPLLGYPPVPLCPALKPVCIAFCLPQDHDIDLERLVGHCANLIKTRPYHETRHGYEEDDGLCGLLRLQCALFKHNPQFKESPEGRVRGRSSLCVCVCVCASCVCVCGLCVREKERGRFCV